jgi:hypothetical protein
MSTSAYNWLEDRLDPPPRDAAPADMYPCQAAPSLAFRQAVVRGDVGRARGILRKAGKAALDIPKLAELMYNIVQLGLMTDVLNAGLSAEALSRNQQELWVAAACIADRATDVAALLYAGFAASADSVQAIRLKAIRSGAWRYVERALRRRM